MRKVFFLLFTAGLIGCSSAPPPDAHVALHGGGSTPVAPSGFTHCECDITCTATGQEFVGLSSLNGADACARGRRLCTQSGCTSCVQSSPVACE